MTAHITSTARTTARPKPRIVSVVSFFGLVFFATWIVWVPRALESRGLLDSHWAHLLGRGWTYMPALAAVVFVALTGGRRSLAELGRKLLLWRIGWRWYVAIVTIPLGIALITAVIYALTGGGQFSAGLPLAMDLPLPMIPLIIAIRLLTDGIGEETAWRGVALPQLLRRMNGVTASLILGIVWACWHLPLIFTVGGTDGQQLHSTTFRAPASRVRGLHLAVPTHPGKCPRPRPVPRANRVLGHRVTGGRSHWTPSTNQSHSLVRARRSASAEVRGKSDCSTERVDRRILSQVFAERPVALPAHGIGISRQSTRCWLMIAGTNSAGGMIPVVFGTPIAFAITGSSVSCLMGTRVLCAVPPGHLTRAPRRLHHRLLTHHISPIETSLSLAPKRLSTSNGHTEHQSRPA
jgi:membrane protease YdiL (CAAX protease family)